MPSIIHLLTDPQTLIASFGLFGIVGIVFAETGLFFGFFFPGDSLLFTAGLLASQGYLPTAWLFIGSFLAAVIGDSVGYAFGRKIGPAIFTKDDSVFFNKKHIARAQHFYEKYGPKAIVLARFMPVVRTFAPIVAGVGSMDYRRFIAYNVVGGLLWTAGMLSLGYGFGSVIPAKQVDRYLLPVIVLIIVLSVLPALREILKKKPPETGLN